MFTRLLDSGLDDNVQSTVTGFQQVLWKFKQWLSIMDSSRDSKENKLRPLANRNYNLEESVITVNVYERYSLCSEITDERLCNVTSMWVLDDSLIRGIDIEKILSTAEFHEMPSRSRDPGNARLMKNPELEDNKNENYWYCVEMGFICKREEIKLTLESVQRKMGTQLSEKISEFLPEGIVGTSKSSTIPKLVRVNFFLHELSYSYRDQFLFSLRKIIPLSNKSEIVRFPPVMTNGLRPKKYILFSSFSFPLHLKKNSEVTASCSHIESDAVIIEPDESVVSETGIPSFCGKCKIFFSVSSESLQDRDNDEKEN
ncbi:hypothetical protein T12_1445 [Trichinella patagoniensis]|uniref:Uncharacterized protein n=1 Tax=Trichinella patagoniensis TaxID=990121 RepID=A0A0V0ZC46_9BILA|nr:hypothetical protein T12_1445 [Trichinella patagoniensis]